MMNFKINKRVKEDPEKKLFQKAVLFIVIFTALAVVLGTILLLRVFVGPEEIKVPNVVEMPLEKALLELQRYELYPKIHLRESNDPDNLIKEGNIIAQNPKEGTLTKAGRRIDLTVSQGARIDRIPNFVGMHVNDVFFAHEYADTNSMIEIKRPVIYTFSNTEPGIILAQSPSPGLDITQDAGITLVVSRGTDSEKPVSVPDLTGMSYVDAVTYCSANNQAFVAELADEEVINEKKAGIVTSQSPDRGTLSGTDMPITFKMTPPPEDPHKIFGFITHDLPYLPVFADLLVSKIGQDGIKSTYLTMKRRGGYVSIPYHEEPGTTLILSFRKKEISRITIRGPVE